MCDCYEHKCEGCDKELPVHLGGFATDRDEIKVWCGDCW